MCGISGIISLNGKAVQNPERIYRAIAAHQSRGPDSNGVSMDPGVVLGHNRLSIIDVSGAASQPFTDDSGRYTIVFNGEFFNFGTSRNELLHKGINLRSASDTEVLLHLYILYGPECLQRVNGFFALAIYDRHEDSVFIARDRMGIKPLLIYRDENCLMFASEMKALIGMGIRRQIDETALYCYLQMNYIPGNRTIFPDVHKLDPGSYLLIRKGRIQNVTYYRIPYVREQSERNHISYMDAEKKLAELLSESVERRMISDVPLGAFLSGGVDSSVIVALASRFTSRLKTFSIGFRDEPFFDETRYAEMVAERYKTDHTTFSLTTDDLYPALFRVLDYTDEPWADSSAIAVNILSMHTRKHVTVALSGDGADELFGGYMKHVAEWKARNPGMAGMILNAVSPLLKLLPQSRNNSILNRFRQASRFAEGMRLSAADRYWRWCSFLEENEAARLLAIQPDMDDFSRLKASITAPLVKESVINDVLMTDMLHVLRHDMLVKTDLMSMANSLEVRVPFLDYELVDYVFGLPSNYKVLGGMRKKILQDAFRPLLPEAIYNRPKHGFEVPLLRWMKTGLKDHIENDWLNDEFIAEQRIFDLTETKKLKTRLHSQSPGDVHATLWALIVFQHWWKKHMQGE